MAHQTLEELKAENATETEVETETPQVEDEVEVEVEAETETEELVDPGEDEQAETDEDSADDWMKGDEDTDDGSQPSDDADKQFGNSDMAKTRRKYKAKLKDKDEEVERLRRENEELRQNGAPAPVVAGQLPSMPKREDFANEQDPDTAFQNAMIDYRIEKRDAENQARQHTATQKAKLEDALAKTEVAVDKHYDRVAKLAEESGISADQYRGAEMKVRSMVDSLFPQGGDAIVDALIERLGVGSEKVIYNLGVNKARSAELMKRFADDPTGVSASIYLGQLNGELNAPRKRRTSAPKPAPVIAGDKKVNAQEKAFKKAYDKADASGNIQERFNVRRKARKAGVNTSNW